MGAAESVATWSHDVLLPPPASRQGPKDSRPLPPEHSFEGPPGRRRSHRRRLAPWWECTGCRPPLRWSPSTTEVPTPGYRPRAGARRLRRMPDGSAHRHMAAGVGGLRGGTCDVLRAGVCEGLLSHPDAGDRCRTGTVDGGHPDCSAPSCELTVSRLRICAGEPRLAGSAHYRVSADGRVGVSVVKIREANSRAAFAEHAQSAAEARPETLNHVYVA